MWTYLQKIKYIVIIVCKLQLFLLSKNFNIFLIERTKILINNTFLVYNSRNISVKNNKYIIRKTKIGLFNDSSNKDFFI